MKTFSICFLSFYVSIHMWIYLIIHIICISKFVMGFYWLTDVAVSRSNSHPYYLITKSYKKIKFKRLKRLFSQQFYNVSYLKQEQLSQITNQLKKTCNPLYLQTKKLHVYFGFIEFACKFQTCLAFHLCIPDTIYLLHRKTTNTLKV